MRHGVAWQEEKGGGKRKVRRADRNAWPESIKFLTVVKLRGIMPDDLLTEDEKLDSILESVRTLFA